MREYIVIDVETTGLSFEYNEIIEIGAWHIKDGVAVGKFSELVKPVRPISTTITQITGITNEMVADARGIKDVLPEFCDFCGNLPLLGHNVGFDYKFIKTKAHALGYDFSLGGNRVGIDTLQIARDAHLDKKTGNLKLETLARYFKIELLNECGADKNFHRAYFDAYMTYLLYVRLVASCNNVPFINSPQPLEEKPEKVYGVARDEVQLPLE